MNKENIKNLVSEESLFHSDRLVSQKAFQKLQDLNKPEEIQTVFDCLMQRGDPKAIFFLCRYLLVIDSAFANELYVKLIHTEEDYIKQICFYHINEIPGDRTRLFFLEKISELPAETDKAFAICGLKTVVHKRRSEILCHLLETNWDREKLILPILENFELIESKEALHRLEKLVHQNDQEKERKALLGISTYAEKHPLRFFKWFQFSKNSLFRQIAYKTLIKIPNIRTEILFYIHMRTHFDKKLFYNVLSGLNLVQTRTFFYWLMNLYFKEKEEAKSHQIITQLKYSRSSKHFSWFIKKQREYIKWDVIRFIEFLKTFNKQDVFPILEKLYFQLSDHKVQEYILDAICSLKDLRQMSLFKKIFFQQKELVYLPTDYLLFSDWNSFLAFIELFKDFKRYNLLLQSLLQFIFNLSEKETPPDEFKSYLFNLLGCNYFSIRYLAAINLAKYFPTVETVKILTDFILRKKIELIVFKHSLELLIEREERLIISILEHTDSLPIGYSVLNAILYHYVFSKETFIKLAWELLQNYLKHSIYAMRRLVLLKNLAENQKSLFLNLLYEPKLNPEELNTLLLILNRTSIAKFVGVKSKFLVDLYPICNIEGKQQLVIFFSKLKTPHKSIKALVYQSYYQETDTKLKTLIKDLMGAWIERIECYV